MIPLYLNVNVYVNKVHVTYFYMRTDLKNNTVLDMIIHSVINFMYLNH